MKVNYKFVLQWFDGYLKWVLFIAACGIFVALVSSLDKWTFIKLSVMSGYFSIFSGIIINFFYRFLGE